MSLKIAILGTRGIPNNYGGFEHIAGCLSAGWVQKGHEVTVYNSGKHAYQEKSWKGVRIRHCFDPEYLIGTAGQFIYDLNCILDARKRDYDTILMLGYTSSSVWSCFLPKKAVIITNMDGLEWTRSKYSSPVRKFLQYAEKLAVRQSDHHIADSPVIKKYLDDRYKINSKYIAYGAEIKPAADNNLLDGFDLLPFEYFMLMARMEPENNIEMILDGYCQSKSDRKFVVVGNAGNSFARYLTKKYKNETNIIFTGSIFDELKIQTLTAYCCLYFHGHSVGGTNPSLLNAMAAGAPLAVHDNPFNRTTTKDHSLRFKDAADVRALIDNDRYKTDLYVRNNYLAIQNEFNWDKIIDQYENFFTACCHQKRLDYSLKHGKPVLYKRQH